VSKDPTSATTFGATFGGTLTSEALTRVMRDVMDSLPHHYREPDPFGLRTPMTFAGLKIHEIPPDIRPVLRIRDEVPCRQDVRREVNAWLLETFGTRDHTPFARGTALLWNGGVALRKEDVVLLTNCA
jgi:hypothetical protein